MKSIRNIFAVAAALLLVSAAFAAKPAQEGAAPAAAQAPEQSAQPQPNAPPKTTDVKGIGDWTVRCYAISSPSPCEMVELRVAKKNGQRILGFLLAYVPARNQHIIQISVPLGVALQNGLVISSDTYKSGVLKFRRCDNMGCYVEAAIDGNAINSLGRATKAEVQIVYMDGKKYNLVFSLNGFTEAHRTLVDLTRQKAVNPPAQNAAPDAAPQQ
jgi:invasion protein IalB